MKTSSATSRSTPARLSSQRAGSRPHPLLKSRISFFLACAAALRTNGFRRAFALAGLASTILSLSVARASNGTFTWTGAGGDDNWSTGANWGGTAPSDAQNLLHFAGTTWLAPNNNFTAFGPGEAIFFDSGAGSFTLGGNAIKFFDFSSAAALIQNNSSSTQTIQLRVGILRSATSRLSSGTGIGMDVSAVSGDIIFGTSVAAAQSIFFDETSGTLRVTGTANKTVTFNSALINGSNTGVVTIGGLSSPASFTVVFNGANNHSGLTTISTSTLNAFGTNSSAGATTNNGILVLGTGTNGGLASGLLTLGGSTTKSSDANARSLTNNVSIGSGNLIFGASSTGALTFSGPVTLTGTTTWTTTSATTFSGVISGTNNGFTKAGGAVMTLSGASANTYTGLTTVTVGELDLNKTAGQNAVSGDLSIGDNSGTDTVKLLASNQIADSTAVKLHNSGVVNLNGNNETVGSIADLNAGNTGSIQLGAGQLDTNGDNTNTTFSGVISGSGNLAKSGTGTLTLAGANSYSGSTFGLNGTLQFNVAQAAGFTGTLTLGDTTGSNGAAIAIGTGSVTLSNAITVRSGSSGTKTLAANNTTGTATFSGSITMNDALTAIANSGGSLSLTGSALNLNSNRLTVTGANDTSMGAVISGTGNLLKQGAGKLTLTGNNTWASGDSTNTNLFVDKGTIEVGAGGNVGATNGSTTGRIALGSSNAGSAGDVSLVLNSAGTVLANPIDSRFFTGVSSGKTIGGTNTSGTVEFSGTITLHDTTTLTAASGGIARFSGVIATGAANSPYPSEGVNSANVLFTAGPGIIITGPGTVEYTAANTYTAETHVKSGTLQFSGGGSANGSAIRLGDNVASSDAAINIANASGGGNVGSAINPRLGAGGTKTISSTNTSGTNTYSGAIALDADVTVLSTNANATLAITQARATPTDTTTGFDIKGFAATFNGAGNTNVSGTIYNSTGSGTVTKNGTGTLSLSGANTYTGTTTISGGILEAGATGALGQATTGTSNIIINTGGTLLLSNTGTTDRINNAATMNLAGGTVAISGNVTEGSSPGIGALTLSASGVIDFANGDGILKWADSHAASWTGTTLSIYNWTSGSDHLFFGTLDHAFNGSDGGLTNSQLLQVSFFSGNNAGFLGTGTFLSSGGGEIVPVPEPSSVTVAMGLLGLVGWRERRKAAASRRALRMTVALAV